MKTIQLTQGYFATVPNSDFARVSALGSWQAGVSRRADGSIATVYAVHHTKKQNKAITLAMHRFILGITDSKIKVDHKDGDGLHNWRRNLRVASKGDNAHNSRLRCDNLSGFKGVWWNKNEQRYKAGIRINGKNKHLGTFPKDQLIAAIQAYDRAAIRYFGRFACTNASLGLLPTLKKPVQSVRLLPSVKEAA
jgi:hypothetical protein